MPKIIKDSSDHEYSFPDEATSDQIIDFAKENKINFPGLNLMDKKSFLPEDFTYQGTPFNPLPHLAAGLLQGAKSLAQLLPNPFSNPIIDKLNDNKSMLDKFDPYKLMGIENKSFTSPEGFTQLIGELITPGVPIVKAGSKVIPPAYKKLSSIAGNIKDYFSPQKHGKELLEKLGEGAPHLEANAQNLSKKIMETFDPKYEEASQFFNFVRNQAGKEKIYEKPNPIITTRLDEEKRALSKIKDLNIGELANRFEHDPSFNNAHNLKTELGSWIGEYKAKPFKTAEEKASLEKIKNVRDQIEEDIFSFLGKRDKNSNIELLPRYKTGVDLYRENVSHFLENEVLRDIVKGRETNIENIHKIFKYPTSKDEGMTKVINALPESAKNNILFSRIKGLENIKNPKNLFESLKSAKNAGYSRYVTPELEKEFEEGLKKVSHQKALKFVGIPVGSSIALEEFYRNR